MPFCSVHYWIPPSRFSLESHLTPAVKTHRDSVDGSQPFGREETSSDTAYPTHGIARKRALFSALIPQATGLSSQQHWPPKSNTKAPPALLSDWSKESIHEVLKRRSEQSPNTSSVDILTELIERIVTQFLTKPSFSLMNRMIQETPQLLKHWLSAESTVILSVLHWQFFFTKLPELKQTRIFKEEELRNALLNKLAQAVQHHQDVGLLEDFIEHLGKFNLGLFFMRDWIGGEIRRQCEQPNLDATHNEFELAKKTLILNTLAGVPMAEDWFKQTPSYFLPSPAADDLESQDRRPNSSFVEQTLTAYLKFASSQVLHSAESGFDEKLKNFVRFCTDNQLTELLEHVTKYAARENADHKISASQLAILHGAVLDRSASVINSNLVLPFSLGPDPTTVEAENCSVTGSSLSENSITNHVVPATQHPNLFATDNAAHDWSDIESQADALSRLEIDSIGRPDLSIPLPGSMDAEQIKTTQELLNNYFLLTPTQQQDGSLQLLCWWELPHSSLISLLDELFLAYHGSEELPDLPRIMAMHEALSAMRLGVNACPLNGLETYLNDWQAALDAGQVKNQQAAHFMRTALIEPLRRSLAVSAQ